MRIVVAVVVSVKSIVCVCYLLRVLKSNFIISMCIVIERKEVANSVQGRSGKSRKNCFFISLNEKQVLIIEKN